MANALTVPQVSVVTRGSPPARAVVNDQVGGEFLLRSLDHPNSFCRSFCGLLIAFPNAGDRLSRNHESLKSKIPKRKKARSNTSRCPGEIQYSIKTNSGHFSGQTAFFTDDEVHSGIEANTHYGSPLGFGPKALPVSAR